MSPTLAELAVGLIAAVLVFMLAVRVIPLIIRQLANYLNRSLDERTVDRDVERDKDHYER